MKPNDASRRPAGSGSPKRPRGLLIAATVSAIAPTFAVPPAATAQAAVTHEVEFGEFTTSVDGEILSSFPATLRVHQNDVIHFHNELGEIPDTGVHWAALLPNGETPDAWMDDEGHIPDAPWALFVPDPDESPRRAPAAWKANRRIGLSTHPYCGQTRDNPCDFDGSGDPNTGVMTSGLGRGQDSYLDFYVRITAEPGSTLWALCPFHPTIQLQIVVVSSDEPATTPEEASTARDESVATWDTKAAALHDRYRDRQVGRLKANGAMVWEAWPGLPRGPLFLVGMYPRTLRIAHGDYVRWHSAGNEIHTVSFPLDRILTIPWNEIKCDPDTDNGNAEDMDPVLPTEPYCAGGGAQLEIDLHHTAPFVLGDRRIVGPRDFEVSGFRSMNYSGIETRPYRLRFVARSPQGGFRYVCSLHTAMRGRVVVR